MDKIDQIQEKCWNGCRKERKKIMVIRRKKRERKKQNEKR